MDNIFIQVALIFVGLNAFYWLLYKYLSWRKSFIQPVAVRVRLSVYLLIPLCTLNWIGSKLYQHTFATTTIKPLITWLPRYGITALLIFIAVETLLVLFFDYYYAVRRDITVPKIIQSFTRGLVYVLVVILVLLNLFNIKIVAGVLAGSLILLFGVGLLMQDVLSNLLAGFSLQITKPFDMGDWIRVGGHEGVVESTTWRCLTIRTATGDHVTFPLNTLAKMELVNLTSRQSQHADEIQVVIDYAYPPKRVEQALREALRDIEGISEQPSPETRLLGFEGQGIRYAVKYWIASYEQRDELATAAHRAIWYHFRRAEIHFAYPASNVYLHQPAVPADNTSERISLLHKITFLQILTPEQMHQLAGRLRLFLFAQGETIIRQGEAGQTFYVISRGRVRVSTENSEGQEIFSQELHVGDFFGEFSLFTGELRSATITALEETELLVLDKEDMRQALNANAQLADYISEILAQRRHELLEHCSLVPALDCGPTHEPQTVASLKGELLRKIVSFFSY